MPAKVAEIGFCGFRRSKKTGGLLNWGGRLFFYFTKTSLVVFISITPRGNHSAARKILLITAKIIVLMYDHNL